MSGRKQFDENQALTDAMRAFWAHGYEATSLTDLERATGLNKSSLYNAYGSKAALYDQCLQRFGELHGKRLLEALNHPEFRAAIEGFFNRLISRFEDVGEPKGCLATMAALEVGGHDGDLGHRVKLGLDIMHKAFSDRCRQAVFDGQVQETMDCEAMGAMLLAMTRGLAVLDRGQSDPALVRSAVQGMLHGIG
jgi:TetR/AcrR family transcriptional regulator, transcriptional repressor for nem operon